MIELNMIDKDFSEEKFLSKVNNIYTMLCMAIMEQNLNRVNHYVGDELYHKLSKELEQLKQRNYQKIYEQITICRTSITNIEINAEKYIINVNIETNYVEYIINQNTGKVVYGNDKRSIQKNTILKFEKNKNAKGIKSVIECPNCGASIDLNVSGQCQYCQKIFELDNYDWILTEIIDYNPYGL